MALPLFLLYVSAIAAPPLLATTPTLLPIMSRKDLTCVPSDRISNRWALR